MSCLKYTPKERSGTTAQVCAAASLRKYDPFHDYKWNWKPHLRYRKTSRRLKPMSYRQLVEYMLRENL